MFSDLRDPPSAAVLFALRLQQRHHSESDLPGVRLGMHLGEVSESTSPEDDAGHPRVEGLAVDLAARICSLARPAQVLMSSPVAASARQRFDIEALGQPVRWHTHGRYTLKGTDEALEIYEAGLDGLASFAAPAASEKATPAQSAPATPVARKPPWLPLASAMIIVLAGLAWWLHLRPSVPPQAPAVKPAQVATPMPPAAQKTIAVLPFVNMSSDKENEYFSDGITEDLITALSKVSGLHVAARTSSFAFKGKNEDVRAIGTALGVGAVLEGSVAKAGNQVRITAQLINTSDGYHLWSERYDREFKNIFAIRSEIAQTVSEALQVTLATGERESLERKPTEDLEAYELYLKGRQAIATFNDFTTGARYLQEAIARDPSYALAYNGLAYYYWAGADWLMAGSVAFLRSREAAKKALQFDPTLAEAHVWLGAAHLLCDRDPAAGEREFQTALAMQPGLASVHQYYGWFLGASGHLDEGIAESRRAVALDPLSPEASTWLSVNLYFARRYDEAIAELRATLSSNPDFDYARLWLGRAYTRTGRYPVAIKELQNALQSTKFGRSEYLSALGRAYADAGNITEATKVLNELRERSASEFVSAEFVASVQAGLHDTEGALASLAQAENEHSYTAPWWNIDPELDPLRVDPRFIALVKTITLNE